MLTLKRIQAIAFRGHDHDNGKQVEYTKAHTIHSLGLAVIACYNVALLIMGLVVARGAQYFAAPFQPPPSSIYKVRLYFYYCTLPGVVTIYSLVEFGLHWVGKLRPVQVLIAAPIIIGLFILSFLAHSTYTFCTDDWSMITCAYSLTGVTKYKVFSYAEALTKNVGYYDLVAAIIYALYFIYAAFLFHRTRNAGKIQLPVTDFADDDDHGSFSSTRALTTYTSSTLDDQRTSEASVHGVGGSSKSPYVNQQEALKIKNPK